MLKLTLIAAAALMATTAANATTIDGVISPGEYANATVTNTPYNPNSDTTLNTFSNGSENVAQTIYFQDDPNGLGFDFAVKTDPAGAGHDNADASLGEQFTNSYFGNATDGALLAFEEGNQTVYDLNTGVGYNYGSTLGIQYADVAGTSYANGGDPSTSEFYVPFASYNAILTHFGLPTVAPGDEIQARDLQAFGYGGNNAGGGNRFGSVEVPSVSAAPEPGTWALMFAGVAMIGGMLRLGRKRQVGSLSVA